MPNVLGLDLSITAPGLCADDNRAHSLKTDSKRGDLRLNDIRDFVRYSARVRPRPVLAVIEERLPGSRQRGESTLTMVHGAIRTELNDLEIPYVLVWPTWLKQFATGDAGADKAAMIDSAEAMSGAKFANDDQADAWWLRRMGLAALRMVPATDAQMVVLGKVGGWPVSIDAWGPADSGRRPKYGVCKHKIHVLRNGDHWLHPFNVAVCDKPPA
jgi:hypothetical protein